MGIDPIKFWDYTFAEFSVMADGHGDRMREDMNKTLFLAWRISTWNRSERIPQWRDVEIKEVKKAKQQTPEEMIAAWKMIIAVHGGQVVEV